MGQRKSMSALLRRYIPYPPALQDLVLIFGILSLLLVQLGSFADDPGVGWHLQSGLWMLDSGSVPLHDPFLAFDESSAPRRWVSDQWLSDLFLALIYRMGDLPLIYAVMTVVYLWTFFGVVYHGLVKLTGLAIPSSFAALAAFKIAQIHFVLRPVIFGFLFFSIALFTVLKLYRLALPGGEDAVFQKQVRRACCFLPVLFVVWANAHPSFSLGLVVLGLLAAGTMLDVFFFPGRWENSRRRWLVQASSLLCVLCGLATLINPNGWELHLSIVELSQSDFFMSFHDEWLSPDFSAVEGQLFQGMIFVLLFGLFTRAYREGAYGIFDLLLCCLLLHLSFDAVRVLPFFGIALAMPVAEAVRGFSGLASQPGLERLARAFRNIEAREQRLFRGGSVLILASGVIVLWSMAQGELPLYRGPFGPSHAKYPYEGTAYLVNRVQGEVEAVVSPPDWGGFITWKGAGKLQAVIDDRNTLLGETLYREFFREMSAEGEWRSFCTRRGAGQIMIPAQSGLAKRIRTSDASLIRYSDEMVVIAACGDGR